MIHKNYAIVCDYCRKQAEWAATLKEARLLAYAAGFRRVREEGGKETHLCARCVERYGTGEKEVQP